MVGTHLIEMKTHVGEKVNEQKNPCNLQASKFSVTIIECFDEVQIKLNESLR